MAHSATAAIPDILKAPQLKAEKVGNKAMLIPPKSRSAAICTMVLTTDAIPAYSLSIIEREVPMKETALAARIAFCILGSVGANAARTQTGKRAT